MSSLAIAYSDISKPMQYNPYEFFRETHHHVENTLHANDPDLPSDELRKKAKELILETYCEAARELASDKSPRNIAIVGCGALAIAFGGFWAIPVNPVLGILGGFGIFGVAGSTWGTCATTKNNYILSKIKTEITSAMNGNSLDQNAKGCPEVYDMALHKLADKLDQFKPKILLPVTNG